MLAALAFAISATSAPVSALACYGDAIYVGWRTGALDKMDKSLQAAVHLASKGKPVFMIAPSSRGVAWLGGNGSAIRERAESPKPDEAELHILAGGRETIARFTPAAPVRRLGWLGPDVAISYDFGGAFFTTSAKEDSAAKLMPKDAADLVASSSLWTRELPDGTDLLVLARPHAVRQEAANKDEPLVSLFTAYQIGDWQRVKLGGFASTALDAFPIGELVAGTDGRIAPDAKFTVLSDRIALGDSGILGREVGALISAPVVRESFELARTPSPAVPGDALWCAASGDTLWWWNGSALVEQDTKSGATIAHLPWSARPTAFACDAEGAWVGTDGGVIRASDLPSINLSTSVPSTATSKRLLDALFAWRFAPAEEAGSDGALMVASVFSGLGIQLPQTFGGQVQAGAEVKGELRLGDVIYATRGAAIYVGGDKTVEVRGGKVQNGDVWSIEKATVRRFAPTERP